MGPSDITPVRDDIIKTWSTVYDEDVLQKMTYDELYRLLFQRIRLGVWISDLGDEGKTFNDKYRH